MTDDRRFTCKETEQSINRVFDATAGLKKQVASLLGRKRNPLTSAEVKHVLTSVLHDLTFEDVNEARLENNNRLLTENQVKIEVGKGPKPARTNAKPKVFEAPYGTGPKPKAKKLTPKYRPGVKVVPKKVENTNGRSTKLVDGVVERNFGEPLENIFTLSQAQIEAINYRLFAIFSEHLGLDKDFKYEDHMSIASDLGADSLDQVEILMSVEDEFGFEIPDAVAEGILTVGQASIALIGRVTEEERAKQFRQEQSSTASPTLTFNITEDNK